MNRPAKKFKGDPNSIEPLLLPFESCPILKCGNISTREVLAEENATSNQWHSIVKNCMDTKKLFIDETFPRSLSSLYYDPRQKSNNKKVKWVRICDVLQKKDENLHWALFRDDLTACDVNQGSLGDCWVISALAVLAERKDLLQKVVITKQICPQGVYHLRLCKNGIWTDVLIDDFVPCNAERVPLYCKVTRKQLWMLLIEKAMAKLHGCYESLEGGNVTEALSTLTGAPCTGMKFLNNPLKEDIWPKLLSFQESNYLMLAYCGFRNFTKEKLNSVGLYFAHAYSVLDIREVKGHYLLQLRNPRGIGPKTWNGDWCYESVTWDLSSDLQNLKHDLIPRGKEDDRFWISCEDFLKYFYGIGVCKIRKNWNVVTLEVSLLSFNVKKASCFVFSVIEVTEMDISLLQDSQRNVETSKRSYPELDLVLFKKDDIGSYKYLKNCNCNAYEFVSFNTLLEPGEYLVVPLALNYWHLTLHCSIDPKYVLKFHISKNIKIKTTPSFVSSFVGNDYSIVQVICGENKC